MYEIPNAIKKIKRSRRYGAVPLVWAPSKNTAPRCRRRQTSVRGTCGRDSNVYQVRRLVRSGTRVILGVVVLVALVGLAWWIYPPSAVPAFTFLVRR